MSRSIAILLVVAICAGCGSAKYEEVSDLPAYADLIGKKYRTQRQLQLLGITSDRNYRPVVDYFLIMGTPSIAGPEVVERRPLPAGSPIEVVKAMRCKNCAYSSVRIAVRITPEEAYENKPVYVDDRGSLLEGRADGVTVLNPDLFDLISD